MSDPAPQLSPTDVPAPLDAALKRLSHALDRLDSVAEHLCRVAAERSRDREVGALDLDKEGRLARDLDAARARTEVLERATQDVAERLSMAGTAVRRLLLRHDRDA